jgi:hypothetical protein
MADYGSEVEFGASVEPLLIAVCDDIDPNGNYGPMNACAPLPRVTVAHR